MIDDNDLMVLDISDITDEDWQSLRVTLINLKIKWKWIKDFNVGGEE